ncbi:MAG: hypothetical protein J3Q66DRAFT_395437 [Benniella sp.]|nr:MAG: hypothetical protein J3Q66DRAFT_395437 [Benniella sp.]
MEIPAGHIPPHIASKSPIIILTNAASYAAGHARFARQITPYVSAGDICVLHLGVIQLSEMLFFEYASQQWATYESTELTLPSAGKQQQPRLQAKTKSKDAKTAAPQTPTWERPTAEDSPQRLEVPELLSEHGVIVGRWTEDSSVRAMLENGFRSLQKIKASIGRFECMGIGQVMDIDVP